MQHHVKQDTCAWPNCLRTDVLLSIHFQKMHSDLVILFVTDAGSIPVEPVILLGRLVTDSGSGDGYSGEIFFSDGTGCIACEVSATNSLTVFTKGRETYIR